MSSPVPRPVAVPHAEPARRRRMIAVGGGKGGIGKTLVSSSLAIELARRGKEVVLLDADLGGANVHTCLGMDPPLVTLSDFVNKRVARIEDVALPTGIEGLRVVAGALDALDAANPKYQQKQKLLRQVQQLDVDYVVLDLGAGTHFNVLDFFLVADQGIAVLMPEPTSIENVYRFVKAAFFRRLGYLSDQLPIKQLVEQAMSQRGAPRTPYQLLTEVERLAPEAAPLIHQTIASYRPGLIVNQARSREDLEMGYSVTAAWKKFFGLEMDFLGALSYDDEVWRSVRRRRPVLVEKPSSRVAQDFASVVNELLFLEQQQRARSA
ncbi:MAG: P-loop NTPase [Deltaproteobacteria bacterium]|nr:P-loop NTPase [Deltaproteobacteria bacterium]